MLCTHKDSEEVDYGARVGWEFLYLISSGIHLNRTLGEKKKKKNRTKINVYIYKETTPFQPSGWVLIKIPGGASL